MNYPLGYSEIHDIENLSKKLKSIPKKEVLEIEQLRSDSDDEALAGDFVPPPPALSAKQLYKDEMSDTKSSNLDVASRVSNNKTGPVQEVCGQTLLLVSLRVIK